MRCLFDTGNHKSASCTVRASPGGYDRPMDWDSSAFLGFIALGFLVLLMAGKILVVFELKSQNQVYRKNLHKISDIEDNLESSRRKYLIALKAEGVAKHRVSQLKTRLASLKQHAEQLALTAAQEVARKKREKEQVLELAVLQAMGGAAHRDSHFLRVMKVITQLIDVEEKKTDQEVVEAVRQALEQLGSEGMIEENGRAQVEQAQKRTG